MLYWILMIAIVIFLYKLNSRVSTLENTSFAPITDKVDTKKTQKPARKLQPHKQTQDAKKPERIESKNPSKTLGHIKKNWPVWLGATALVLGSGFLVQHISQKVTFPLEIRAILSLLASGAFFFAGLEMHKKSKQASPVSLNYVPAILAGAGLTGFYCSVLVSFSMLNLLNEQWFAAIISLLSFSSIILSAALGPLMAIVGAIGGYLSPAWFEADIGVTFALVSAISVASITALSLSPKSKQWLTIAPIIATAQLAWNTMLIRIAIANSDYFSATAFFAVTSATTLALLFAGTIPKGDLRKKHEPWSYSALVITVFIALAHLLLIENITKLSTGALIFTYMSLAILAATPLLIDKKAVSVYSVPIFAPLVAGFVATTHIFHGNFERSDSIIHAHGLFLISISAVMLALSLWQPTKERKRVTQILFLTPCLAVIATLMWGWFYYRHEDGFTTATAIIIVMMYARTLKDEKFSRLASSAVHFIIAALVVYWLDTAGIMLALALQAAVMSMQLSSKAFAPKAWAMKVIITGLISFLTLNTLAHSSSFIETAFIKNFLLVYLPPLVALWITALKLKKYDTGLYEWFEYACLHIVVLVGLIQTKVLVSHLDLDAINRAFVRDNLLALQASAIFLVYSLRRLRAEKMQAVYRAYSFALFSAFAFLAFRLNTFHSPLFNGQINISRIPLLNVTALGWLLPGSVLLYSAMKKNWVSAKLKKTAITLGASAIVAWCAMSIRHIFQASSTIPLSNGTSSYESFTYSLVATFVGIFMASGLIKKSSAQKAGLGLLIVTAAKIFLLDTATLNSSLRAIILIAFGLGMIGLGWRYQHLKRVDQ